MKGELKRVGKLENEGRDVEDVEIDTDGAVVEAPPDGPSARRRKKAAKSIRTPPLHASPSFARLASTGKGCSTSFPPPRPSVVNVVRNGERVVT